MAINSICIFCGSSSGSLPAYTEAAQNLGRIMAARGITLVYGGSNVGLMREIADACLQAGGKVVGVMPHHLIQREVAHRGISEFHPVETMAERKAKMEELSDAFVAMPGGIGTLDELFEAMSWNQLDLVEKPVALFNVEGFYDGLVQFLDLAVAQRFIRLEHRQNLLVESEAEKLLHEIQNYSPRKVEGGKWIKELRETRFE